jgi:hypothetical protein
MVGFIKGLFGSKAKQQGEPQGDSSPPAKAAKAQAYFLDADSAKTLGDLDYMRTAKAVRRTFPKTLANPDGFEKISQIASIEQLEAMKEVAASVAPEAIAKIDAQIEAVRRESTASQNSQTSSSQTGYGDRRSTDTSMDMFRNMARDIKKR